MIDFGDAVVFATVESERILESPDQQPTGGGRPMIRYVDVRIDDVLWGEPSLVDTEVRLQTLGGFTTDDGYVAQVELGAPILEVDGSYVIALFSIDGSWSQQTGLTVFPVRNGAVDMEGHALAATHPFDAMTVEELGRFLAAIPLDPDVEQHRDKKATERLELASDEADPSPGP